MRHIVLFLLVLCLSISGCAAPTKWAPGPGQTLADFEPTKARCSLMARHGGTDFAAVGSQSYVAGAALGHAIGDSIRAQEDFSDCMRAAGWTLVTPEAESARNVKVAQWRAVSEQSVACVSEIRNNPRYDALQPHLPDAKTAEFTMEQLSDEGTPSATESKLIASYTDETKVCITDNMRRITDLNPVAVPIFQQLRSDNEKIAIMLVRRQITWGEASRRQKANIEATKEKLRANHV